MTASPPPALADPAITTPLAAAILPSQQQAAAAPLAPALEEILRSLDEQAYQATLVGRDDDDDGIDDDDDDTADARDVERPLLRRSRAARAKERINKQRRVIKQKLAGLRRAEKEINPTGASATLRLPESTRPRRLTSAPARDYHPRRPAPTSPACHLRVSVACRPRYALLPTPPGHPPALAALASVPARVQYARAPRPTRRPLAWLRTSRRCLGPRRRGRPPALASCDSRRRAR